MPQSFDTLPDPKKLRGKTIVDTETRARLKSDGTKWIPVQPPQVSPEPPPQPQEEAGPQRGGLFGLEQAQTLPQKIVRGAAPSIVGGAVGAGIGTAIMPGAGTVIGAMIGSGGGEAVQQFFDPLNVGVKEPDELQIALATLLPGIPAAFRAGSRAIPGAQRGLQDFLFSRLGGGGETLLAKLGIVPGKSAKLFEAAHEAGKGLTIRANNLTEAVKRLGKEANLSEFSTKASFDLIERASRLTKGFVSFDKFRASQIDLGARVGALARKGGPALGRAKALYKAVWADMKNAPPELKEGIEAFKREQAGELIKTWWLKATKTIVGDVALDTDALINRIRQNIDVFEDLLPRSEIDDLINTLKPFTKIPLPQKTGQFGFQSGIGFGQRLMVSGGAGALGFTFGGLGGGAAAIIAIESMSLALSTTPGRAIIRTLMSQGMAFDQIVNVLLQSTRAGAFGPTPQRPPSGLPSPGLTPEEARQRIERR